MFSRASVFFLVFMLIHFVCSVVSLKADCFLCSPKRLRLVYCVYHTQVQKMNSISFLHHLLSCGALTLVSYPPQVQTVPCQCLPTPPSGAGKSTPRLGWPGLPTRPWWTKASCGSLAAMSSTLPTITWSKRKYSPL